MIHILRFFIPLLLLRGIAGNAHSLEAGKIAASEAGVWRAFYIKDLKEAEAHLESFLEQAYAIPDARKALPFYLKAMTLFGETPHLASKGRYDETILPLLKTAFRKIRKASSCSFDPDSLAEKELEWWVARRIPHPYSHKRIGAIMAEACALSYGGSSETYKEAALGRAFAVTYRDKFETPPEKIFEEDWEIIQNNLFSSYRELKGILEKDIIFHIYEGKNEKLTNA